MAIPAAAIPPAAELPGRAQAGSPEQAGERPRFAELVGHLDLATVPGQPGILASVHLGRVRADAAPGRALMLTGTMMASLPARAGREADLQLADSVVTGRLGERPGLDGSELVVTVINPPVFGLDGVASAGSLPGEGRPGRRLHDGSTP